MHKIEITENLAKRAPDIVLSCIECDVQVVEKDQELWGLIVAEITRTAESLKVEDISKLPAIAESRRVYKRCGKDPARYRLSAEALLRRAVKRGEIYQINNVVDLLNLVSVSTGFSIGGYDAEKITGEITFGIGEEGEPYAGIGRGELNIENMPVFRDSKGAFGTSTSDSERTAVTDKTKRFLMIIIDYGNNLKLLKGATLLAKQLLEKYAGASNVEWKEIKI